MGRGGVLKRLLRTGALALVTAALGLAAIGPVAGAASGGGPTPDPPPVKPPPPPPQAAPPPPQPVAPPPPPVSRSSGPSAAEIAAARLAAERRAHAAKVRAQRAKQLARAKRIAAQRAKEERIERQRAQEQLRKEDEAEARRAAGNPTETRAPRTPAAGFAGDGESSSKKTAPLVVIAFLLALVVLTLGLVPAYLVPWYRISMVLEEHRQQFTWVGGMAVLATGVLLLMVVIGG